MLQRCRKGAVQFANLAREASVEVEGEDAVSTGVPQSKARVRPKELRSTSRECGYQSKDELEAFIHDSRFVILL